LDMFSGQPQDMHEGRVDPALEGHVQTMDDGTQQAIANVPINRRKAADHIDPEDPNTWGRVSRNAACPCQSGKKYKHCHGRLV